MFTGLVEKTGQLSGRVPHGPGFRLHVATDLGPLELGESVSVNGVCLTVTVTGAGGFDADVSVETVEKTTLGGLAVGERVNLERSLAVGDRLGGHLVSGHVDGVGEVESVDREGDALRASFVAPTQLLRFVASKGSICVDGVSLTVNGLTARGFHVMLIPHTVEVTSFRGIAAGRAVNLEVDMLARYVVRYLESRDSDGEPRDDVVAALEKAGRLP